MPETARNIHMTGPEHYRIAEMLVANISDVLTEPIPTDMGEDMGEAYLEARHQEAVTGLAAAQVHATLALAAATADTGSNHCDGDILSYEVKR